jgi:hypothetical protein
MWDAITFSHIFCPILQRGRLLFINPINIIWKGNRLVEIEDDIKIVTCGLSSIP